MPLKLSKRPPKPIPNGRNEVQHDNISMTPHHISAEDYANDSLLTERLLGIYEESVSTSGKAECVVSDSTASQCQYAPHYILTQQQIQHAKNIFDCYADTTSDRGLSNGKGLQTRGSAYFKMQSKDSDSDANRNSCPSLLDDIKLYRREGNESVNYTKSTTKSLKKTVRKEAEGSEKVMSVSSVMMYLKDIGIHMTESQVRGLISLLCQTSAQNAKNEEVHSLTVNDKSISAQDISLCGIGAATFCGDQNPQNPSYDSKLLGISNDDPSEGERPIKRSSACISDKSLSRRDTNFNTSISNNTKKSLSASPGKQVTQQQNVSDEALIRSCNTQPSYLSGDPITVSDTLPFYLFLELTLMTFDGQGMRSLRRIGSTSASNPVGGPSEDWTTSAGDSAAVVSSDAATREYELKATFSEIDGDSDGVISLEDLRNTIQKCIALPEPQQRNIQQFNRNNKIMDIKQGCGALGKSVRTDYSSNSCSSRTSDKTLMGSLEKSLHSDILKLTTAELRTILHEIDNDCDGLVTYDDFRCAFGTC